MLDGLFGRLALTDVQRGVYRNIVSIHVSQDLFDDLSDDAEHWRLAQQVEAEAKPPPYRSTQPVIDRPFEDAVWFNAIGYPFRHWQRSRFSDGTFGVWYGSDSIETTVFESVHHWYGGLLADAGYGHEDVVGERKVYQVDCHAALLNLAAAAEAFPALLDKTDYGFTQSVGVRLHREGHPGAVAASARHEGGANLVVLNPKVLSSPRLSCQLSYRVLPGSRGSRVAVQRQPGTTWLELAVE